MYAKGCRLGFVLVVALGSAGCGQDLDIPADPSAETPTVSGTYEWTATIQGENPGLGLGTITFAQDGDVVAVTNTTHESTADRDLMGSATFEGNVLVMQMVPRNGETDYSADVTFRFTADGSRFDVDFTDSNNDFGPAFGVRRSGE